MYMPQFQKLWDSGSKIKQYTKYRSEMKKNKSSFLMDNIFCVESNNFFFFLKCKIIIICDLLSFFYIMMILWIKLFPLSRISGWCSVGRKQYRLA